MSTDTLFSFSSTTHTGRHQLSDALNILLADTFTLYLIYRNLHWNVSAPQYHTLHKLFSEHYHELQEAIDEIAERIRALGHHAAASYAEYLELSSIHSLSNRLSPSEMARQVIDCHRRILEKARVTLELAHQQKDVTSADLIAERIGVHEKCTWMLEDALEPISRN